MKRSKVVWLGLAGVFILLNWRSMPRAHSTNDSNAAGRSFDEAASARRGTGTVFYVSLAGNDAWSGRLDQPNSSRTDGPFRNLERAQQAIRRLKAGGPLKGPVTVYLRGGEYDLKKPLVFTPQDSGTPQDAITYASYPGERAVLSGGRKITGWKRVTQKALIRKAGGELWMADVPGVKQRKWYFRELFVDGQRRQRARAPNEGFFYVDGKVSLGKPASFKFHGDDIRPAWAQQGNVEVVVLQAWAEFRMYIRKVDEASHSVTLSSAAAPSNREDNARFWVENTMDALDAPGEWYLHRKTGVLYYRPESGENMARIRAIAPALIQLVRFEGRADTGWVHNIRLSRLTLSYTDWSMSPDGYADVQAAYDIPAAVEGMGTRSCTIQQCTFAHLGGYAVEFGGGSKRAWGIREGSKDDHILDNAMYDLGAGGVKIGDPKNPNSDAEATVENIISNNHIHDLGRVYPAGVGVWVGESSDNTISHNEINNTYYTGISVGWTWGYGATAARRNVIAFNNIHNIGRGMLSDMGCIYTLGVQPGTAERNNLCHDVSRYKYGGWGIYTDEGSSDILIEDNVVYRTEDGSFHQNYGAANIIRNNIFALGENAQIRRSQDEPHLSFNFEHNIVYWNSGTLLQGKWDDDEYHFDHNLYYRVGGRPVQFGKWSFGEWQARGQDRHSIIADPLFVDPSKGDFSLQPGSPAIGIGFKPIDLTRVGPQ